MNNLEHYLEVAKECGAIHNPYGLSFGIMITQEQLEAYTARILADKEAELKDAAIRWRDLRDVLESTQHQVIGLEKQLSEAQALIAMQAEALKLVHDHARLYIRDYAKNNVGDAVARAIFASAEAVAAWEEAKLKPLQDALASRMLNSISIEQHKKATDLLEDSATTIKSLKQQVAMLQNVLTTCERDDFYERRTAALDDTQATAEAHDKEVEQRFIERLRKLPKIGLSEHQFGELRHAASNGGAE